MEDQMQSFTHATGALRGSRRNILRLSNVFRPDRVATLFGPIAKLFPRIEGDIADRYSGCSWGDETERRVLDDVFNGQRGSFFR
jgi:hypothetical protein